MKQPLMGGICVLATAIAGCATSPTDYAATLSKQDRKWQSPQCQQARRDAADYEAREKDNLGWSAAPLFGPYGVPLVAAIKEQEQKQRRRFSREVHIQCSSLPLPRELQTNSMQSTRVR
jgi:hypothetical protein